MSVIDLCAGPGGWGRRPARWGDLEITGLSAVQLHDGALLDIRPHGSASIHLVRRHARGGTPGPLLCGLDHHTLPVGFSVGGGRHRPELGDEDPDTVPCPVCVAVAARMILGAGHISVSGSVGGDRARRSVEAELERLCPGVAL